MPRLESPASYILFSGLYCISAAIRRKVIIPRSIFGAWELSPHIYVMYVGPAGVVRKTTSMDQAISLLSHIPVLAKGPNMASQASLLNRIVESDDNAVYLTVTEMSDIIMKSGPEMYAFLTSMFDGHKKFEATTVSRGIELTERPCLNMIAATTPEWIVENMTEAVIGGGFASRCIFLFETEPRWVKLYFKDVVHKENDEKLEAMLIEDLQHISMNISGEFDITPDALEYGEQWNKGVAALAKKGGKLASWYGRKPTHMHKIAMLLQLAQSDELVISLDIMKEAIRILDATEVTLKQVFEGIGKNAYTLTTRDIVKYVTENKKVERGELLRVFNSNAEPRKLDELLEGLQAAKQIVAMEEGSQIYYYPKKERTKAINPTS